MKQHIPREVSRITETLQEGGFDAYLIGGCVRDLLMQKNPKDWDITTNATPDDIISLFEETFYENDYGTVGVVNESLDKSDPAYIVEVTPYRLETAYSDNRRPDTVTFSDSLDEDLKRRDFTINAIAYDINTSKFIDPHKGQYDIKDKILRTVGNPSERFAEDALRMLRAVRLATQLGFTINANTFEAVTKHSKNLETISKERIRDEFSKIIDAKNPMEGLILAHNIGVLQYIVPELEAGIGVDQNGIHIYDVWEHNLRSLQHAADKNYSFHVKLAALLHDVSKPKSRRWSKDNNDWTFYGHDVVGGRVSREILKRLKFPSETIDTISKLVRNHMFFSDVEKITLSAVRRIIVNVGKENIWELVDLRTCDRIGTGRPKEIPYRLRKYKAMIDEALHDPISVGMLKIDGQRIMDVTREKPGPKIGFILHALLEEVLDEPKRNTETYLEKRTLELIKIPVEELRTLGEKGKEKKEEEEEKEVGKIRKKHWVE